MKAMRRYYALLTSSVFFVAIVSMYLLLDQATNSGIQDQLQEGDLSMLEVKLNNLEDSLRKNRETINEIKDTVKALVEGDEIPNINMNQGVGNVHIPGGIRDTVPDYGDALKFSGPVANIYKDECTFGDTSSGISADVKMLDVFDTIKFDDPNGGVWKQGFDISYSVSQDWYISTIWTSWIKTFELYFRDQTQHILDNMVVKLLEDKRRKFIWAEISYFSRWWEGVDMNKKKQVIELLSRGQLEIVSGGWVMPDEANTHYFAMLDQMIEGHTWVEAHLGIKPTTSWAIDPFGHSPTMAYLLQRSGIQGMLIQRVHYSVKKYLAKEKQLEFLWRQNWDHGSTTDMFCHMMPFYSYDVPHTCGPDPQVCCQFDFKRLPGGRVTCPWKIPPVPITDLNVASNYDVPHTCGPDPQVCCQFDFKRLPGGRVTCPWKIPPVPITDLNVASLTEIERLVKARRQLGLFQHHDGITGTAKDNVVIDYGQRGFFHVFREIGNYGDFTIENAFLTAKFSGNNGLLQSLTTKSDGKTTSLSVDFVMYGTRMSKDKSGAYLFLPDGQAKSIISDVKPIVRVIRGRLSAEVHVLFENVEHVVKLHKSTGKHFIIIHLTIQKRKYLTKVPLQGNVYPMPLMAYLEDDTSRLTLHTAQPLGVASLEK
ncbi:alpha-mannosidase 2-like, partial [Saccoglossus kowalevskii]